MTEKISEPASGATPESTPESALESTPESIKPKFTDEDVTKSRGSNVLNEENTIDGVLSAYERWELPSMAVEDENANNVFITTRSKLPPVVIEDEEEVVPLTAEDVEAIAEKSKTKKAIVQIPDMS